MAGFNPFTSSQSLADFLNAPGNNGETPISPELELGGAGTRVLDELTGRNMQQFLDDTRSAGAIPEFTDMASIDSQGGMATGNQFVPSNLNSKEDKLVKQNILDTLKLRVSEDIGLTEEDWDLNSITDFTKAKNKSDEILARAKKAGMLLESSKADEIGLRDLQDQYNRLRKIPGASTFGPVREQLANLEVQIGAAQDELDTFIHSDNQGNIAGDMGPAFVEAQQLAAQWNTRSKELLRQADLDLQGKGKDSAVDKLRMKATLEHGGPESVMQLANTMGITEDQVLDRTIGGQIPQGIIALNDFEVQKGREAEFEEVALQFGKEATDVYIDRLKRTGRDIAAGVLETINADMNNDALLSNAVKNIIAGEKAKLTSAEQMNFKEPKGKELEDMKNFARMAIYEEGMNKYRDKTKKTNIVPERFSLKGDFLASPEEQQASEFLIAIRPQAFTYNPDPKAWAQDLQVAKTQYEKNPARDPNLTFDHMFNKMYGVMVEQIEAPHQGTGIEIFQAVDPETSILQMEMLTNSINESLLKSNLGNNFRPPAARAAFDVRPGGSHDPNTVNGDIGSAAMDLLLSTWAPQRNR